MQLHYGQSEQDKTEISNFSYWLLKIGEGKVSET